MTNKQKTAISRQMCDILEQMSDGKKTSTALLLSQVDMEDVDFAFDEEDLMDLHDGLLYFARCAGLRLEMPFGMAGLDYLGKFTVYHKR